MKQIVPTLAAFVLMTGAFMPCAWAATDAGIAGVVHDEHGRPTGGAFVELLGPGAKVLASVVTDPHGHYVFEHLVPGSYKLRASAAFLLPVVRSNLSLRAGSQVLADLTMTAIFEAGSWLPAEIRTTADRSDDWRWALRSAANRPMLRFVGESSEAQGVSSSSEKVHDLLTTGQVAVLAGDGRFGDGGTHQVLSMGRTGQGGDLSLLTANFGGPAGQGAGNTSLAVAGCLEHNVSGNDQVHLYASFASHPELETASGASLGVLETATTERISLGDVVVVDVGTLLTAERLLGTRFDSAPYMRVAVQPSPDLVLEYRFATSRALQSSGDLDEVRLPEEVLTDAEGRPLLRKGMHQELSATHSGETTRLTVAVFHDSLSNEAVQATGLLTQQALQGLPILADPTTGTMRIAVGGYAGFGARVRYSQALSSVWSIALEADSGKALASPGSAEMAVTEVGRSVHAHQATSLRGSVQASVRRTGTSVNAHYRWQPAATLTQVDEFNSDSNEAALGFNLRQRLWAGRHLKGLNAVVEASNLLAEGYEPVLAPDGQTLFLAQVPRAVQGGLAFTF